MGKSRSAVVDDEDEPDRSEEQFAASLGTADEDEQFGSATLNEVAQGVTEPNTHDCRARETTDALSGIDRRMAEERALEQQAERWRDEVASRVEGYRQKRSRKQLSGEFSMRFDWEEPIYSPRGAQAAALAAAAEPEWEEFDSATPAAMEEPDAPVSELERIAALMDEASAIIDAAEGAAPHAAASTLRADIPDAVDRKPPMAEPAPARRRLRNTNLIEFPRLPFMPPPPDELAEPVMDRPRILDVPDEIVQELAEERTPLGDIALEPHAEELARRTEFDVPLQVAPLVLRFGAAMVDATFVVTAALFFLTALQLITPGLPHNRTGIAMALAVPAMLWAMYHYVFLVHGDASPGMRLTHLRVRTFDGEPALRAKRRWRALAMMLSFMPLGVGIAWALADEDTLCWHDRITRTYLTRW